MAFGDGGDYGSNFGGTKPPTGYTPPSVTPPPAQYGQADDKYKPENLQSWMNPAQYAQYQQLAAGLKPLLLGGETFDYYKFLTDPSYAQLIETQINRDPQRAPAKQAAFSQLLDFFKQATSPASQQTPPIDVAALFNPLKAGVDQYGAQALQEGKAEISRQSAGAESRAAEGLAGTGLGRSGVAAGAFQGIQTQRTGAVERLLGRVQDYEMRAKMEIDRKIADVNLSQKLYAQGLDQQQIQDALNFQRSLTTMQFQDLLQASADDRKSFWDSWGGLIETGATIAGGIIGGPAGAAAGAAATSGGGGGESSYWNKYQS